MIKKNDFIEIDYTGFVDGKVFDTTKKDVAQNAGIDTSKAKFESLIICVGEGHILKGLDTNLEGKDLGSHKFELNEEEAFGKKQSKLLKLMPMKLFKQQKIQPFVGLELNIDNQLGTVRNVSGGRVIVDFNHPLAGKKVTYEVDIKRKVEDKKEKLQSIFKALSIPVKNLKEASVDLEFEVPPQIIDMIKQNVKKVVGVDIKINIPKKEDKKDKV